MKASELSLRSLYEQKQRLKWKIIWHIRYCEWFHDYSTDDALTKRLKVLAKEVEKAESNSEINSIKKFDNKKGLIEI